MSRAQIVLAVFPVLGLLLSFAAAQDRPKVPPKHYKVVHSSLSGGVSFVGRLKSFTDYSTGNLCVRDLKTGETRVLAKASVGEGAVYSAISAD
ncbi:MAG: hypothetical protein ACRD1B_02465, partial [Thermoanaerobaculia bacterium]